MDFLKQQFTTIQQYVDEFKTKTLPDYAKGHKNSMIIKTITAFFWPYIVTLINHTWDKMSKFIFFLHFFLKKVIF